MRKKIKGFILLHIHSDHGGKHIHVYRDNRELGVHDRVQGPIRGLENEWNTDLESAIHDFWREIDARFGTHD